MDTRTLPCPFCKRPLQIPLTQNGKIGCRQCRNISVYNRETGELTPLRQQAPVIPRSPQSRPKSHHSWQVIFLIVTALAAVAILLIVQPWDKHISASPDSLEEIRDLLKSLAE